MCTVTPSKLCLGHLHTKLKADACFLTLQPFFEAMHRAIRPGGVVCTQVILLAHYEHMCTRALLV